MRRSDENGKRVWKLVLVDIHCIITQENQNPLRPNKAVVTKGQMIEVQ